MRRACDLVCVYIPHSVVLLSVHPLHPLSIPSCYLSHTLWCFCCRSHHPSLHPPHNRVLYFRLRNSTIYNVSLATPTVVNRMYPMSGSASLSSMVYQPSNNALIWVNLNASTIEMFFVANQSVRVIASYVGSVAGMGAVGWWWCDGVMVVVVW